METRLRTPPVFTSNLKGGVGNQLFQIAIAYAFAKKHNGRLLFKKLQFSGCGQGSHPYKYYKNLYEKLEFVESIEPTSYIVEKRWLAYLLYPEVEQCIQTVSSPIICFDGYWQSMTHFQDYKEDIKNLFTPKEGIIKYLLRTSNVFKQWPELKEEHDFCFIGVRRGDYIKNAHFHNPCGMTYYEEGMRRMNKTRYYIASDDYEWCKKKFVGEQFHFFEIQDDLIQLLVSTLFKSYIMANSTFNWWGSFLSIYPNPSIIAPDKWLLGKDAKMEQYSLIYRPEMTILERPIETD